MQTTDSLPLHRHPHPLRELARRWRYSMQERAWRGSFALSLLTFAGSIVVYAYAAVYANEKASNYVSDIILSNTRPYDVDGLFVYGTFCLIAFILLLCIANPKRIPFTLNSLALLFVIRSGFTSLTHIGPFPTQVPSDFGATITGLFFGNDFFFSGHTAAPFIMALIYWRTPFLRYLFVATSVFFGIVVLLGHLHYTIDVASAFFITYSIYCIAEWLMPRARSLFYETYAVGSPPPLE